MIKLVNNNDDIIKCWAEAFGDSNEDILYFINNAVDKKCVAYYDNSNITSMLYLVKCNLGYYIYAACTLKQYQGNGYMTELINYCKKYFGTLCLIPATDSLVEFYSTRGFSNQANISDLKFNQTQNIIDYLLEGYNLTNPKALIYQGE